MAASSPRPEPRPLTAHHAARVSIVTTLVDDAGRDSAIDRFLDYHGAYGVPIVVAKPELGPQDFAEHPHVDAFACGDMPIFEKLATCLERATTPYVAWIPDDDFVTGDFLARAVDTLDGDASAVACDGLAVQLEERSGRRTAKFYTVATYRAHRRVRPAEDDLPRRLVRYGDYFQPMALHGVIRTATLLRAIRGLDERPVRWADNLAMASILGEGPIRMLPTIACLRSFGTRVIDNAPQLVHRSEVRKAALLDDREVVGEILDRLEAAAGSPDVPVAAAAMHYLLGSTDALARLQPSAGLTQRAAGVLAKVSSHLWSRGSVPLMLARNPTLRRDYDAARRMFVERPLGAV